LRLRGALPIAGLLAALVAGGVPGAARADVVAMPGEPVTVFADGLGSLQFTVNDSPTGELYGGTQDIAGNGLALRVGAAVSDPGGFDRVPRQAPVISGQGTRTLTSAYDVPRLGLRVAETETYASGAKDVTVEYQVTNTTDAPLTFSAGELADLYVANRDDGTGVFTAGPPRFVGGADRFEGSDGLVEVAGSTWTAYQESEFSAVFQSFAADGLTGTIDETDVDNGVGAEWTVPGLAAGATKTIDVIWRLDPRAPTVAAPVILSPAQGSTLRRATFTVSGTAPASVEVDVEVDGEPQADTVSDANGQWSADVSGVPDGAHGLQAQAFDPENGVVSPLSAPVSVTVAAAPQIADAPVSGSTVTLTGTAGPNAAITILEGATEVGSTTAGSDGGWTVVLRNVSPGTHTYTAVADGSTGSAPRTVTVASTPAATPTPTPTPTATPTPLPPPVTGKAVNAQTKSGTVKIKLPGKEAYVVLGPGQQIPTGTVVDTTHGRVTLTTAVGGGTQQADFYDGLFKVTQSRGGKPLTTLALTGPKPTCTRARAASAAKRKVKTRKLWGSGHGAFRTQGQFSSATVRGTTWLTQDSCAGTLTRVTHGVVQVQDLVRHKRVLVRAGHSYLARPKRH
jgi:hypothetical protein